ncbi:hypothetical protein SAMN02746089_01543 [Caldanaerobius fijiensis DSM 17918]|uniref:Uncharacterized protein n=1 Tax=Caldanaerobius fijiensis DSM 17918 TaxID=1121256 RepID=A0A1M5A145_9THEO|nr:hypothetical protein SAMN02746089_01543 [Caldanaerobius fijiensis DSM 17918]
MIIIPSPTKSITEYIDLGQNIYIPQLYGYPVETPGPYYQDYMGALMYFDRFQQLI